MEELLTRVELENGLKVVLKEIHSAPIISHWLWYQVGSRYEKPGLTGVSHWVEHMLFKGTPNFPAGILDKAISRDGGYWNAFTFLDWTTFFETVPAGKVDLPIALEADRMVNSLFDIEEVSSERTVIISEREGSENEPLFLLDEAIQAAAFEQHPYRNEIIGSKADLLSITRDDLYNHYRDYYSPGNAVLALAGDFNSTEMLEKIKQTYQKLPGSKVKQLGLQREAPLRTEKRVEVCGPGETTYLVIAWRAPEAAADDFFSFTIADSLLTGPSSLNMFGGGGVSNKTSRLYRRLVEREFAISVNGSLQATYDPYLYSITITVNPRRTPEEVLHEVDEELDTFFQSAVKQTEIDRAAKQARALFAYGSENITNQAFWLGYSEMFADYSWFTQYTNRLAAVTPEVLLKTIRENMMPEQRVVGIYRPDGEQA